MSSRIAFKFASEMARVFWRQIRMVQFFECNLIDERSKNVNAIVFSPLRFVVKVDSTMMNEFSFSLIPESKSNKKPALITSQHTEKCERNLVPNNQLCTFTKKNIKL